MVLAPLRPSLQLMICGRDELGAAKSWIRGEHEAAIKIIRAIKSLSTVRLHAMLRPDGRLAFPASSAI
jgi:hypothetical protein